MCSPGDALSPSPQLQGCIRGAVQRRIEGGSWNALPKVTQPTRGRDGSNTTSSAVLRPSGGDGHGGSAGGEVARARWVRA